MSNTDDFVRQLNIAALVDPALPVAAVIAAHSSPAGADPSDTAAIDEVAQFFAERGAHDDAARTRELLSTN